MKITFEWFVIKIQNRLSIANIYLEALEKFLPQAQASAKDRLNEMAKIGGWPTQEYLTEIENLEHDFEIQLPRLAGAAFIVYLHSIVEYGLRSIADKLKTIRKIPLGVSELSGSSIERSKKYLTKLAGIQVGKDPAWSMLRDLAKIRNLIVHTGGELQYSDKLKQDMCQLVKKYGDKISMEYIGLQGTPEEVHISLLLCKDFLYEVEQFFRRCFDIAELKGVTIENDIT